MKHRKLVVSTHNEHKLEEIRKILKDLPVEVLSKNDVGLGSLDVVEDGDTLEENSIKKAKALAEQVDYMVLADDTGLFVDALNGEPGVYSSRYSGEEGNSKKNVEKLLGKLKDVPFEKRKAKFITAMALITEDKRLIVVKGECKGTIGYEPKGNNGFGYDPIFIPDGYTQTFAEMDGIIKNKISHRARALENLREKIIQLLEE